MAQGAGEEGTYGRVVISGIFSEPAFVGAVLLQGIPQGGLPAGTFPERVPPPDLPQSAAEVE